MSGLTLQMSIYGALFLSLGFLASAARIAGADTVSLDFRSLLANNVEQGTATVSVPVSNQTGIASLSVTLAATSGNQPAIFKNVNNLGLCVKGGTSNVWWDVNGTNGSEQLLFRFDPKDANNASVDAPVYVRSLLYRRGTGSNYRVLFESGSGSVELTAAATAAQSLTLPFLVCASDTLTLTRTGTDSVFQLIGMTLAFTNSVPQGVVMSSDPTISTHVFTAGVLKLGLSANGGGFVNHVSVNGGGDLMSTEARYGRGWQGSVRDSLHGGRYNPTQAGFRDFAGAPVTLTNANGRLLINRFNVPLYSDPVFDFTAYEDLAADYEGYNDGLNVGSNPSGTAYTGDTDGYAEPAGWTQDDEVRSEFDFEGFFEDASAQAGHDVSAVRFFQRYSYVREPKAILQFGTNALLMSGAPVYNASVIAQAGDLSSTMPGTQLATAVDLAGVIFTSYGMRLSTSSGYTHQMWYSGGRWRSAPVVPGQDGTRYKIPGSGIAVTDADNPDYGFLIAADGTNAATAHGFALYVPMTEVNAKCVVGRKTTDGGVAYRENRLTDCILFFASEQTNMVSIRARYFLKGLLSPTHCETNVYEALESDQYVLYGTPNDILASVCALETNLLAGTSSAHGTPQTWLDAYGLSDEDADTDGDGAAAWQEYRAGTDPVDSRSLLMFTSAELGENQFVLRWQGVKGKRYTVLSTADLQGGDWETNVVSLPGVEPQCVCTVSVQNADCYFKVWVQ